MDRTVHRCWLRLRENADHDAAILGAAVPLAAALAEWWQAAVLALALALVAAGRPALWALGGGALAGLALFAAGAPLP